MTFRTSKLIYVLWVEIVHCKRRKNSTGKDDQQQLN